jgi:hypothetical protein
MSAFSCITFGRSESGGLSTGSIVAVGGMSGSVRGMVCTLPGAGGPTFRADNVECTTGFDFCEGLRSGHRGNQAAAELAGQLSPAASAQGPNDRLISNMEQLARCLANRIRFSPLEDMQTSWVRPAIPAPFTTLSSKAEYELS